jgi:hypothetical protein
MANGILTSSEFAAAYQRRLNARNNAPQSLEEKVTQELRTAQNYLGLKAASGTQERLCFDTIASRPSEFVAQARKQLAAAGFDTFEVGLGQCDGQNNAFFERPENQGQRPVYVVLPHPAAR